MSEHGEYDYRILEINQDGSIGEPLGSSPLPLYLDGARTKVAEWTAGDVAAGLPPPVFRIQRRLIVDWEDIA